jgi:ATP-dependent DNA helicase RecG
MDLRTVIVNSTRQKIYQPAKSIGPLRKSQGAQAPKSDEPKAEKSGKKPELSMSVQYVKGVGPARAKVFARLGVHSLSDLLEYFPREWNFAPEPVKINQVRPDENVTIVGIIESVEYQSYRKTPIFEAIIADDTGVCRLIWFHGGYLRDRLLAGQAVKASGKANIYKGQLQLTNPKYILIEDDYTESLLKFGPAVYPASSTLSSGQIKKIITPVLGELTGLIDEFYEESFRRKANLTGRRQAFEWIHSPPDEESLARAKRRLKYDELFLMQLGLAVRKYKMHNLYSAIPMQCDEHIDKRIRKRFPFLLTKDQDDAIAEILQDMADNKPMNRLLQGDVGSGKTVVALYAALLAVARKTQVAIMAPTEILAEQHFISMERYLRNSDVRRVLLTGGITGKKRKELLKRISTGRINIVVGTIALLHHDVQFDRLGLVVIDEQHKFGVHQRAKLRKDTTPHCLVMTATPIPRTLAMTAFGDLDVSIIKHSPPGRGKVVTRRVEPQNRQKAYEFIRQHLQAGKQAYFVFPRIAGTDEEAHLKAAIEGHKILQNVVFPEFSVGLLHGRMSSQKKQTVMTDFRRGKIKVLVSTVVVEVGLDVPNATIMVIEAADNFGLAQLHQLRGRIGRGQDKAYCLLFAEGRNDSARSRLEIMTKSNDGFEIAEHDLRMRGPGELFSTRQHGLPDLKIANIVDDFELLVMARKNAFELVNQDSTLSSENHRNIRTALLQKFGRTLGLADIA